MSGPSIVIDAPPAFDAGRLPLLVALAPAPAPRISSFNERLQVWCLVWVLIATGMASGLAADFLVTAPSNNSFYTINGMAPSPTLTLVRGQTYVFEIDACECHPFEIRDVPPGSVVNNDIFSGTLTFTVPQTEANWIYWCSIHHFDGDITTVAAAAPMATTMAAASVTASGATLNANVHPNGTATSVSFIFGTDPTLTSGLVTTGQAIGSGPMSLQVNQPQAGLSPSTTYYFRVQATNATGTSLGNILSFTTGAGGPDIAVFNGAGTAPGDERADNTGVFSFATTPVGNSSASQTFTLQNTGNTDLTGLAVTKAVGGNETDFAVDTSAMATDLGPGSTTTFSATFSPAAEGVRSVVLAVASNDPDENPFEIALTGRTHAVGFDEAAQNVLENAVAVTIPVRVTAAAGVSFSVPVSYGGSAIIGTDYTHSGSSLAFSPTQTVANLKVTIKEDALMEGDDTVIITLGTPSVNAVTLGSLAGFTLTIAEDDVAPVIDPQPQGDIVGVGDPVNLTSGATGSPPLALQWKKDGKALPGATGAAFNLGAAALADAGAYTFTATNGRGTKTSVTAQLAVVDDADGVVRANAGSTASMSVTAKGNFLSYRWRRDGTPLDNSTKYAGVTSKTLSIKNVAVDDMASYSCQITNPAGSLASGDLELQVPTAPPVAAQPVFPDAVAHNPYSYQLPFDPDASKAPTRFVCLGLPAGLTCNATTGIVSGKATVTGDFNVTVTLSNAAGTAAQVQDSFTIVPFPTGAVGAFVGYAGPHGGVNAELGGRIDLTSTNKGSFTGKLKFGAASHTLTGAFVTAPTLGAHPMASLVIPRTGKLPLRLTLDVDPALNEFTGAVQIQGDNTAAELTGWRNSWRTAAPPNPVTAQLGSHACKLELDNASAGDPDVPQGYSFATIAVTAAGATTVKGRLADGGTILVSAWLGPNGEVLVYQSLNSHQGSLLGELSIAADVGHTVAGMLAWKKNVQGSNRDYPSFGPVVLNAAGGTYTVSKPVLDLPITSVGTANAQLVFTEANVDLSVTDPNVEFRISDKNTVTMPPAGPANPGKITSLTWAPTTGAFGGKFTLTDPGLAPRTAVFQGQLVPALGKGYGWFLLPQSPQNTSAILSGKVVLEAAP